jgi:hypothetical protein
MEQMTMCTATQGSAYSCFHHCVRAFAKWWAMMRIQVAKCLSAPRTHHSCIVVIRLPPLCPSVCFFPCLPRTCGMHTLERLCKRDGVWVCDKLPQQATFTSYHAMLLYQLPCNGTWLHHVLRRKFNSAVFQAWFHVMLRMYRG